MPMSNSGRFQVCNHRDLQNQNLHVISVSTPIGVGSYLRFRPSEPVTDSIIHGQRPKVHRPEILTEPQCPKKIHQAKRADLDTQNPSSTLHTLEKKKKVGPMEEERWIFFIFIHRNAPGFRNVDPEKVSEISHFHLRSPLIHTRR